MFFSKCSRNWIVGKRQVAHRKPWFLNTTEAGNQPSKPSQRVLEAQDPWDNLDHMPLKLALLTPQLNWRLGTLHGFLSPAWKSMLHSTWLLSPECTSIERFMVPVKTYASVYRLWVSIPRVHKHTDLILTSIPSVHIPTYVILVPAPSMH